MYQLNIDQVYFVSGGDENSYKIGYEVGKAMGGALKYASFAMFLAGLAVVTAPASA